MCVNKYFLIKTLFFSLCLLGFLSFTYTHAVWGKVKDDAIEEAELQQLKRSNEAAQAEYYREQLKKLREPSPQPAAKTLNQSIQENPAIAIGTAGAIIAALLATFVGVLNLYVNNRAARRLQRDTQFYEALKRFGDKDSATARSSAAGLLAQMSQTKQGLTRFRPYLTTVLEQLSSGLVIEDNKVVVTSIKDGLIRVSQLIPRETARKLYRVNRSLQESLTIALAEFFVAGGSPDPNSIDEELWRQAETLLGYDRDVYKYLTVRPFFMSYFKTSLQAFRTMSDEKKNECQISTQKVLLSLSSRIKSNVEIIGPLFTKLYPQNKYAFNLRMTWDLITGLSGEGRLSTTKTFVKIFRRKMKGRLARDVISEIGFMFGESFMPAAKLRYSTVKPMWLYGSNLYAADLSRSTFCGISFHSCDLRKANLAHSAFDGGTLVKTKLQGANLSDCRFSGTLLGEAEIDDKTNFEGADWWNACFVIQSNNEPNNSDIQDLLDEAMGIPRRNGIQLADRDHEKDFKVDVLLLETLSDRYPIPPTVEMHLCVREYFESLQKAKI